MAYFYFEIDAILGSGPVESVRFNRSSRTDQFVVRSGESRYFPIIIGSGGQQDLLSPVFLAKFRMVLDPCDPYSKCNSNKSFVCQGLLQDCLFRQGPSPYQVSPLSFLASC